MGTNADKKHTLSIQARKTMRKLLALLFPARPKFEPHPETVALHARLDHTNDRMDAVLHKLRRGISSKDKRSHLAVVGKGE